MRKYFSKITLGVLSVLLVLVIILATCMGFVGGISEGVAKGTSLLVKEPIPQKVVRGEYVRGEIIVKFKPGVKSEEIADLNRRHGVSEKYTSPREKFKILKIPTTKTVPEMVEIYRRNPNVEYAEPNYIAQAFMRPNDPQYWNETLDQAWQWHFPQINMEQAWDVDTTPPLYGGDPSVVVAVIDTGVAYEDHTDTYWHLDTYNAYGGTGHSWWCGMLANPAWSTPPGYGNNWNQYLLHQFDLTAATGTVTLSYQHKYDIERNFDYAYVEASIDGSTWTQLKSYTGPIPGGTWRSASVSLTGYIGNKVLVRFRFKSDLTYSDEDGYYNSDGAWYIDNVRVSDSSGNLFYDDMESGPGAWKTTSYLQAPDLAGTSFWTNSSETPGDGIDNDGNGYIDDIHGWDFTYGDNRPNDEEGHGTHVTGTIAQTTNNNLGVAGIAFNASIMSVKVLDSDGSGTYADVADGIYYAANKGADIINLSLGGPASTTLENAVAYAYNAGVTIAAASGNESATQVSYPAAYDAYCIAVGATRYDEQVAYYSNTGTSLDLTAPGGDVRVDQNSDGYGDGVLQQTFDINRIPGDPEYFGYWFYQGTSMSTPHVAGVGALVLAQNPGLSPDEVRNILQSTAKDKGASGWDEEYGWGIVDAYQAVLAATPPTYELTAVALSLQTVSAGANIWPGDGTKNKPVTVSASGSWKVTALADDDFWDTGTTVSLGIGSLKMGTDYGMVNPIPKTGEAAQIASGSAGTGLQPDVHTTLDIPWDREDIVNIPMSTTITYTMIPN